MHIFKLLATIMALAAVTVTAAPIEPKGKVLGFSLQLNPNVTNRTQKPLVFKYAAASKSFLGDLCAVVLMEIVTGAGRNVLRESGNLADGIYRVHVQKMITRIKTMST